MGLNENIKKYRSENDMTLEDVAKKVGVSRQTIQKYESGVISNIPQDKIEKLAEIFHITPSELMGWTSKINFDDGTEFGYTSYESDYLEIFSTFRKINSQKDLYGKEYFENYNEFLKYAMKYIGDIDRGSLKAFMTYIEKTFPEIHIDININELKDLYEGIKDFTEFSLKKFPTKDNKDNMQSVATHRDEDPTDEVIDLIDKF